MNVRKWIEERGRRRRRPTRRERELLERLADAERRLEVLEGVDDRLRRIELAAQFAGTALLTPSGVLDGEPAS
jgi:hypothetical protein